MIYRRSDSPDKGSIWRFDRVRLKSWRPQFEVPWKSAKFYWFPFQLDSEEIFGVQVPMSKQSGDAGSGPAWTLVMRRSSDFIIWEGRCTIPS
jgi:hypothetical protein